MHFPLQLQKELLRWNLSEQICIVYYNKTSLPTIVLQALINEPVSYRGHCQQYQSGIGGTASNSWTGQVQGALLAISGPVRYRGHCQQYQSGIGGTASNTSQVKGALLAIPVRYRGHCSNNNPSLSQCTLLTESYVRYRYSRHCYKSLILILLRSQLYMTTSSQLLSKVF